MITLYLGANAETGYCLKLQWLTQACPSFLRGLDYRHAKGMFAATFCRRRETE
jgi:hypothetical protein